MKKYKGIERIWKAVSFVLCLSMLTGMLFSADKPQVFAASIDAKPDITVTMNLFSVDDGKMYVDPANSSKIINWDENRQELTVAKGAVVKLVCAGLPVGDWRKGFSEQISSEPFYYPDTTQESDTIYSYRTSNDGTYLLSLKVETLQTEITEEIPMDPDQTNVSGTSTYQEESYGSFQMNGLSYQKLMNSSDKNLMFIEWYLSEDNSPLNDQNKAIAAGKEGTDINSAEYTSKLLSRSRVSNIESGSGKKMQFSATPADGYAIVGISDGYTAQGRNHLIQYRDTMQMNAHNGSLSFQGVVYGGSNGYPVLRIFLQKTLASDPAKQTIVHDSDSASATLRLIPDWARSAEKTLAGYQYYKTRVNNAMGVNGGRSMLKDMPKDYTLTNISSWADNVLPLVYVEHNNKKDVFDVGKYTSIYGSGGSDWASHSHPFTDLGTSSTVFSTPPSQIRESNEMISMRRFSSTVNLGDVKWSNYDYVGLVSRLGAENVPVNDGLLVYVNGEYAWGGGHGMRVNGEELPIGNLMESIRRTNMAKYKNTDYWYLDIMEDSNMTNLKEKLQNASDQNNGNVDIDILVYENCNAGGVYAYDLLFSGSPVEFTVAKQDADKGTKLQGASFQLYSKIEEKGNGYNTDYLVLDTNTTAANGELATPWKVLPGEYYLVENKAPTGYQKLTAPIHVAIGSDSNGSYIKILDENASAQVIVSTAGLPAVLVNNRQMESIRIQKTGDGGEKLAGAEFSVYQVDKNGNISNTLVGKTMVTDKDGLATSAKAFSYDTLYCIRETKAPLGYAAREDFFIKLVYDTAAKKATVHMTDAKGNLIEGLDYVSISPDGLITVENERQYASIVVTKTIDKIGEGLGNPVFFFRLQGSDGSVYYRQVEFALGDDLTAGKRVVFNNLPAGVEYTLTEEQPMRYRYQSVNATNAAQRDEATGRVVFQVTEKEENYYTATYHNTLANDQYYSAADIVTNHIVKS